MKHVNLVVEDLLSEAVLRRLLRDLNVSIATCYGLQGNNYIRQRLRAFYKASQYMPYVILTDLDNNPCPPQLISNWGQGLNPSGAFIFRVAVKEVESWLLADRTNFAAYLGISPARIPNDVEGITNTKEFLINLAKGARKKQMREDIAPLAGSFGKRGKDYNGALIRFVRQHWDYNTALTCSQSLNGTVKAISQFANL